MSPVVGYHTTRYACRESIKEHGLFAGFAVRLSGVFVFRDDGSFDHLGWNSRTEWAPMFNGDLWEVAYIGPLTPDPYVLNAMVFLADVIDTVTLVTGNDAI